MQKTLWIGLAILLFAISAPNVHADTFIYSYTSDELGCGTTGQCAVYSWTTVPIAAATADTTVSAANLSSFSLSGTPFAGCILSSVILDVGGAGSQGLTVTNCFGGRLNPDAFSLADYSTPGTYSFFSEREEVSDGLTVTAVQTPEPSTVALGLLGLGLAFVIRRKCVVQGRPQAA
jgi:hypothetical protein